MGFSRRTLLSGLGATLLLSARAGFAAARVIVKHIDQSHLGTTLELLLASAPFPDVGSGYRDSTVLVFVPLHYRPGRALDLVVHFHGHNTTARSAIAAHQLREQLWDSKQNAILVVPQGPVESADSSIGKLERPGGFGNMLREVRSALLLKETRRSLEARAPRANASIGTVCVSAHSGGYHAAARAVSVGGLEVKEVYLFDALYNDTEVFRHWVAGGSKGRRRKLVTYFGQEGTPSLLSEQLYRDLTRMGIATARQTREGTLSRGELVRAQAVFVRSEASHNAIVHERNALRDCLYASSLRRHVRSAWFAPTSKATP
jgi:hypothetical protein